MAPGATSVSTVAELIAAVENTAVAHIVVSAGTYTFTEATSACSVTYTAPTALCIRRDLVIEAAVPGTVTFDANASASDLRRVITIKARKIVRISGLMITGGYISNVGGGSLQVGGGVYVDHATTRGRFNMTQVDIVANTASSGGGGFFSNYGIVCMIECAVRANNADSGGAGLRIVSNQPHESGLWMWDSSITDNIITAGQRGGGLYNDGFSFLTNVRITGNFAANAPCIYHRGGPGLMTNVTCDNTINPLYLGGNNMAEITIASQEGMQWTCPLGRFRPLLGDIYDPFWGHPCLSLCGAGFYANSPEHTSLSCAGSCPEGHYCGAGTVAPNPCPTGTIQPEQGVRRVGGCIRCSPGSYGDEVANPNVTCTACAVGSFSEDAGASACTDCPVGGFCASSGAASARQTFEQCPTGYYNPDVGATSNASCRACAPGTANPVPGSSSSDVCRACLPGSHASEPGTAICALCEAGKWQGQANKTACEDCVRGRYCVEGASSPIPCPGGTHMDTTLSVMTSEDDCVICPAGTFCSVGSETPTDCAPGTYNDQLNASTCVNCAPGSFQDAAGSTLCKTCTPGYYCAEGSAAPLPCPGGTHKDRMLSVMTSVDQCITCPAGTSCSVGSAAALPCLPGSIANQSAMEKCDLCLNGQFQRAYGQTACEMCVPGFYCKEGAAEPVPCPAGYVGSYAGFYSPGQCTPVPIDYWAPLGSAVPEPCPTSGFYCPGALRDELWGGSKPIIMPIGQSTRQDEVRAVTKAMTLDISIDDFAAQRDALKIALAAQYGVDPSLVTLEASAGSVQLTITIATTDGAGNAADLAAIESTIATVGDADLATTIGGVTGSTVSVVSQPPVIGIVTVTVPFSCPRGKWCTAGLVVDCPVGSYNPLEDQDFATACILCPLDSSTATVASTSKADCVCVASFYDANASSAIDQDLINAMLAAGNMTVTMTADVVDCKVCPVGTDCRLGSTLEELPLLAGYYRVSNGTFDVRECPDARQNCSTTFGTAECVSTSGCQGGTSVGCAPGLSGTFCQLCDRSDGLVFYAPASDDAVATCKACGGTLATTIAVGVGGLAALGFFMGFGLYLLKKLPKTATQQLARFNENFTPRNKIKVVLTFYQLATKVSPVYEVSLPPDVNEFLESLGSLVGFGLEGVATTPLECLGLSGYRFRLLAYMISPAVIIAVVILIVCVSSACEDRAMRTLAPTTTTTGKKGRQLTRGRGKDEASHGGAFHLADSSEPERETTLFEKTLPAVLTVLFLLYPLVTKVAFDGFPCFWFENDSKGWLRQDVSIQCSLPDERPTMLSWAAVIIYPVGIWSFCALLLLKASSAIIAGKSTPLSRSIGFLHREYDVESFWWELMEMLRKFLLVGLFVTFKPGSVEQIAIGTVVCATYLMVQLQASPYKNPSDDYLAVASSFSLLMVFFCSVIYKYAALVVVEDLQEKMSIEQQDDYIVNNTMLSALLFASVLGSLVFSGILVVVQIIMEIKNNAKLRRLKYMATGKWVECKELFDPQAFHLFLSHAWPAAQDRMRIVKARFLECLPSCRTFLDVDDLKSGSGTAEVDKSECILVFCTSQYFEKKNSLKELYRAVCQRRPILAMLEPDATQEGGLDQEAVEVLITNKQLDKFKLRTKWAEWMEDGDLLPDAFDHAPDETEVRAALFATPPVEWNRLPHFQDVTIRLIAEKGILGGVEGELYLQGEAATGRISLPPPLKGRKFHLFCSPFNAGAKEAAEELKNADVWTTKGQKASAPLTFTDETTDLAATLGKCDHMLVLLDERTWTSGGDTAKFVEHIHAAMRVGVHITCVHEFPSVVGPRRHECEFGLMFGDDWTPAHLTGGRTNLYKEIALALKGVEWRQPGLVAFASKVATSAGEHNAVDLKVPKTYEPKMGPNLWSSALSLDDLEPTRDVIARNQWVEQDPVYGPAVSVRDAPPRPRPGLDLPTAVYAAEDTNLMMGFSERIRGIFTSVPEEQQQHLDA